MWLWLLGTAGAREVTLPVDIGLGPAVHALYGPIRQERPWHTGAVLTLEAIVDHDTIKKFRRRIPEQYREMAMSIEEARIRPLWFLLPETLYLSPRNEQSTTAVWGATWSLLGISVPLVSKPVRLALEPSIPLTVMSVQSDTVPSMLFVRPGLQGRVDLEIPLTRGFLLSGGWSSSLYPPQQELWHIGQAYAQVHVRVPVTVDI